MNELSNAGFQVTMDELEMNVFVTVMTDARSITPTTPYVPSDIDILPAIIRVASLILVVGAAVLYRRRRF
jgi:hypothetical protein